MSNKNFMSKKEKWGERKQKERGKIRRGEQ
jgi:hypothetical protein